MQSPWETRGRLGFLALGLGPDAERRSEPRTSTADGAQGALILRRQHPRTQKTPQGARGLLGAQGLCGCQGGRLPCRSLWREVSLLQTQGARLTSPFPTPQTSLLSSFLELIFSLFLLKGRGFFLLPFSSRKIRRKAEKGRRIKT